MSLMRRSDWPTVSGGLLSDFFDDDRFFGSPWLKGQSVPAVNVKENDKRFEVELAAPGFQKNDFQISLEQGLLTIAAEKKQETEKKEDHYTRREFGYTSFARSFNLPKNTSEEDVNAAYENGVLKLTIAKKELPTAKPRKPIEIK
jgi:HSP20 family protein